jgi:CRISPR-associated protein (TIGR02584 family)
MRPFGAAAVPNNNDRPGGRFILLASVGLQPQIVTETLYALKHETPSQVPDEIHLITTVAGKDRILERLINPTDSILERFARDFDAPKVASALKPEQIHVIGARSGMPLDDITTDDHNQATATDILDLVRTLTRDPSTTLHVSIAAGRKTIGFLLGSALSLLGRPQDDLSHVLVPPEYENKADFFYPPLATASLASGQPSPPIVSLARIPVVKLRSGIPAELLNGNMTYREAVDATNKRVPKPLLKLDIPNQRVRCHGVAVPLRPIWFALYAWIAKRRATAVGLEECAVSWETTVSSEILQIYEQKSRVDTKKKAKELTVRWGKTVPRELFDQYKSKINSALDLLELLPYQAH